MAATLKCDTIQNASSATANITLDTAGNATVGNTLAMGSSFLRNRIINGAMVIDQRNAGASGTSVGYTVDRWGYYGTQASKGTWQQNAGSVTPPNGFKNYLGFTSSSSYSVISTDIFQFYQVIEGFNVADLGFGAAGAQSVTLSFWVQSSLTGTHSGVAQNSAQNRTYIFTFTVSSANTWEYKTITIPGDTTGTWLTNNAEGLRIEFNLGTGSSFLGAAGSWSGSTLFGATGSVSVVGTNGATFYITGVQLEVGSVATPFERRLYGQELSLCQRYYTKSYDISVVPGTANPTNNYGMITGTIAGASNTGLKAATATYSIPMRTAATVTLYDRAGNANKVSVDNIGTYTDNQAGSVTNGGERSFSAFENTGVNTAAIAFFYAASAEL